MAFMRTNSLIIILATCHARAIREGQLPLVNKFVAATNNASSSRVVILDVGANNGMFGWAFASRVLRCAGLHPSKCASRRRVELIQFEPEPAFTDKLTRISAQFEGARYLPYAAWTENTTLRLHRKADSFRSSLLARSKGQSIDGKDSIVEVPTLDLAHFMLDVLQLKQSTPNAMHESRALVFLHLDVEGAEFHLLPRLLITGALCTVTHLLVEFHPMNLDLPQRLAGEALRLTLEHIVEGCLVPPLVMFDEPQLLHANASYTPGLWELAYYRNGLPPSGEKIRHWRSPPIYRSKRWSRLQVAQANLPSIPQATKHMMGELPPCRDGTAYVSLLTEHTSATKSTFLATQMARTAGTGARKRVLDQQMQLLLVMVRSLRSVERCRRDLILLTGANDTIITPMWRAALDSAGVTKYLPVPPIKLGIPSADKIHVWNILEYTKVLFIDSDVMFLRNMDEAFELAPGETFAMAHHPYEMLQAQCGIPVEKRGVGALFLARPDFKTFIGLQAYLSQFNEYHLAHASEQTALACYFRNQSRILPCDYLFDMSMPTGNTCSLRPHASRACLRQHLRNCNLYGGKHMRESCMYQRPGICDRWAGQNVCEAINEHVATCSEWRTHAGKIRSIHFKGKAKPWQNACSLVTAGVIQTFRAGRRQDVDLSDELYWDEKFVSLGRPLGTRGKCVSKMTGNAVYWAIRDKNKSVSYKCCSLHSLLASRWHKFLK